MKQYGVLKNKTMKENSKLQKNGFIFIKILSVQS